MPSLELAYGRQRVNADLPARNYLGTLAPRPAPTLDDPAAATAAALRAPIAAPPLAALARPGMRVTVMVNDITRVVRTDAFLPAVLDELNRAGVPDADVTLLMANGTHRGHTPEELRFILGAGVLARAGRILDHDARDEANTEYVGTTSRGTPVRYSRVALAADLLLLTGEINYHVAAGYSGGPKSLFPGAAAFSSVEANHRFMTHPGAAPGHLDDNPLYLDIVEASRLFPKPIFVVNVLLDGAQNFVRVLAGDHVQAHRAGCRLVDALFGVPCARLADFAIAGCGGYPRDINLYQAQKALTNAALAVRTGGALILVAECSDGHGSDAFVDFARANPDIYAARARVEANFRLGHHKVYLFSRALTRCRGYLLSALPPDLVRACYLEPVPDLQGAIDHLLADLGPAAQGYVVPEAYVTVPQPAKEGP